MPTQTDVLPYGTTLVRHYGSDLVAECGELDFYHKLMNELADSPIAYYSYTSGGVWRNKFFEKVTIHVYGGTEVGSGPWGPGSFCGDYGSGTSQIHTDFIEYRSGNIYRYPAMFSHEFGHAYHNWCQVYSDPVLKRVWVPFWERQVSLTHVTFNPDAYPWDQPWGPGSRDEDRFEQFANAWRYAFGFNGSLGLASGQGTRGSSGPGTPDNVVPGFEDPGDHPEWIKQLRLLPELAAYIQAHGITSALLWIGGEDGHWHFRNRLGETIRQYDFYDWRRLEGAAFAPIYPNYNRF